MNENNKDIGTAFKEAFDEFTVEPNAASWVNIEKENISTDTVKPNISILKYAASIAVIIAITAITYFIINSGLEYFVEKNHTPKTIVELAKDFPKQIIEESKEMSPINTIESKSNITENIKYNEVVKNTDSEVKQVYEVENSNKKNELMLSVAVHTIEIEKDKVNKEKGFISQIYSDDKEDIIESETEIKNNIDSFKVAFGNNKIICIGEDAILEVEEGYVYKWSNGEIGNKVKVSPVENSYYTVTVSNEKGQSILHEYVVEIDRTCSALFIPSAFTPNGDGQNDFFKAEGQGLLSLRMYIYDKNGSKVFESNNIDDTWDGTYKGKQQGAGMFFYVAEYTDALGYSHVKKGQVIIIK